MRVNIIRKILVILIIAVPVFSESGCKKQAKCGCDGDAVFSLDMDQAKIYFTNETVYAFQVIDNPYENYNFCNPGEMLPKLSQYTSGDVMVVSGDVFWNCAYVTNSSNQQSQYTMYYKVYDIMVTKVEVIPFGK